MDPWRLDPPRPWLQIVHKPETVQRLTEFKLTPLHSYPQQTFITELASWAYPVEETDNDHAPLNDWTTADTDNVNTRRKEVSLQVGPSTLPNAYPSIPHTITRYNKATDFVPPRFGYHRRTQNSLYVPPIPKTKPEPVTETIEEEPLAETKPPSRTTTDSPDSEILGYELPWNIPMAHQGETQQPQDEEMYHPTIGTATTEPRTQESKELRINLPKPFTGNCSNLQRFIQDCAVYLKINQDVYNNDNKKIAFTGLWRTRHVEGTIREINHGWGRNWLSNVWRILGSLQKGFQRRRSGQWSLKRPRTTQTRKQRGRRTHHDIPTPGRKGRNILRKESQPLSPHWSLSEIS